MLLEAAGPLADPANAEGPWRDLLAAWLEQLQPELPQVLRAPAYSLGLSLVGDGEMAELNASWRSQQGPTDVLAFAAQDEGLEGAPAMPKPPEQAADQELPEQGEPLELGDIVDFPGDSGPSGRGGGREPGAGAALAGQPRPAAPAGLGPPRRRPPGGHAAPPGPAAGERTLRRIL